MPFRCHCFRWKYVVSILSTLNLAIIMTYLIVYVIPYHHHAYTNRQSGGNIGRILIESGWLANRMTRNLTLNDSNPAVNYLHNVRNSCLHFGNETKLLVTVMTSPTHFAHRRTIRQTWGQELLNGGAKIVFFIGTTNNNLPQEELINNESVVYGDIVQGDYIDTYRNLTIKTFSIMHWITDFCHQVEFVFKVDDDIYVNANTLFRTLSHYDNRTAIYGLLARDWRPFHNDKSKYYISEKMYPYRFYPDFVAGPAYIVTGSAVPSLLQTGQIMEPFPLEDVFFTGFVALEAGVPRINQPGIKSVRDKFNPCNFNKTITSHGHSPKQISTLWKRTHSKSFICHHKG